jgi:hypothetical protein
MAAWQHRRSHEVVVLFTAFLQGMRAGVDRRQQQQQQQLVGAAVIGAFALFTSGVAGERSDWPDYDMHGVTVSSGNQDLG